MGPHPLFTPVFTTVSPVTVVLTCSVTASGVAAADAGAAPPTLAATSRARSVSAARSSAGAAMAPAAAVVPTGKARLLWCQQQWKADSRRFRPRFAAGREIPFPVTATSNARSPLNLVAAVSSSSCRRPPLSHH
jgi:hypothetical protein